MRVSIPATLLITLSAHHYLSHALPLSRPRSIAPRAVDYPVVSVADPDVEAPDTAPGGDEDDDDSDDVVTRTITRESEAPTSTRKPKGSATPTEDCTTSGIVPIVGVKETGAVRSTTTYTTQSSSKAPAKTPAPAPMPSSSPSAPRPTGTAKTPGSTSETPVSEPTPAPSAGSASSSEVTTASASSSDVPADSRNGTSPIVTSSPAIEIPPEESSSSTAGGTWSLPGVIVDTEPEAEPEPTPSSATWSTAPTPAPSGNDYVGEGYDGGDYDESEYAGDEYTGDEYAGDEYVDDVYGGDADDVPTSVSTVPAPLSTGSSEASYNHFNDDGSRSWNGTTSYSLRRST